MSSDFGELVTLSKRMCANLKSDIIEIQDLDILLEQTPVKGGEQYELAGFQIWNEKARTFEEIPDKVRDLNEFLQHNRYAFVLCSPKIYGKLSTLDDKQWNELFGRVLRQN